MQADAIKELAFKFTSLFMMVQLGIWWTCDLVFYYHFGYIWWTGTRTNKILIGAWVHNLFYFAFTGIFMEAIPEAIFSRRARVLWHGTVLIMFYMPAAWMDVLRPVP